MESTADTVVLQYVWEAVVGTRVLAECSTVLEGITVARSCSTFSVTTTDRAASLARARRAILENGGTFDGDDTRGTFSSMDGRFEGVYQSAGDTVSITITRKPFIVFCGMIERTVRGYFE